MFWKNLQESSEELELRKQWRRWCHWHGVMNHLPMSVDTFFHLTSDPNHLALMGEYDGVNEMNYFMETLFQLKAIFQAFGVAADRGTPIL
jgi:hypothetical protein